MIVVQRLTYIILCGYFKLPTLSPQRKVGSLKVNPEVGDDCLIFVFLEGNQKGLINHKATLVKCDFIIA
jgi:hypothetical protein